MVAYLVARKDNDNRTTIFKKFFVKNIQLMQHIHRINE